MSFFKLKEYDDFGHEKGILARAGTLKFFGHKIDTPSPIPTSSDIEKLIEIRKAVKHLSNLEFTQPITEIKKFYSLPMLRNLQNRNSPASERLKNQVENACDNTKFSIFRLIVSRDVDFIDNLNDIYTETQIQAETSLMLIKDRKFNSPINIFDKRIQNTREYIESNHDKGKYASIFPELRPDMPLNLLEQKIRAVYDNGFEGISFIHVPYYKILKQYLHIQNIAQKMDIVFYLAGSPPVWHINKKTSMPHFFMSAFGFDMVSVQYPRRFYNKPKSHKTLIPKKKIKKQPNLMKFNNRNWGLVNPYQWDATCDCPVHKDHKNSASFRNAWNGSGLMLPALNYHNITDGHREMSIARKFIMHKELSDYLGQKKHIAEAVRKVLGKEIDVRQGRLGRWIK